MNNINELTFNSKPHKIYRYGIQTFLRYVYLFFIPLIFFFYNVTLFAQNRPISDAETLARDALEQSVATQDEVRNLKYKIESFAPDSEAMRKERMENAKKLYDKAVSLTQKKENDEASIYFKLAFERYPSINYLKEYLSSVYNLVDIIVKKGELNEANFTLSELKNYTLSNIYLIDVNNIDKAIAELKTIEDKKADIEKNRSNKSKLEDELSLKVSIEEGNHLLKTAIPQTVEDRISLLKKHEIIVTSIVKLSIDKLSDESNTLLKKLSENIATIQYSIEIDKLLNRGYELLKSINSNKSSPFAQQLISESALIGQRLTILQSTATDIQKDSINSFFKEYIKTVQAVTDLNSSKEYDRLKGKLDILKRTLFKNTTKANDAINQLLRLQDEIVVESSNIQDKAYLIKARELVADLNKELSDWQDLQINRYERWATDNIKSFHDNYKDEMGVLGSSRAVKHKIYLGLQDYLCQIDTRFLTISGTRIYTEVFDFFYKELDRDQRLNLSKEFMNCTKKSLNEF